MLCGVVDWRALPSRDFCTLVERLPFYSGALRGIVLAGEAQRARAERGEGGDRMPAATSGDALQLLADSGWLSRKG